MKTRIRLMPAGLLALAVAVCLLVLPTRANAATEGYYTYSVSDGKATITDCSMAVSGDITLPATLGGYPVTGIDEYAFYYCTGLESVVIPEGVTGLGWGAFQECMSLKRVVIPDSVISMGDATFYNCVSLENVTIPNGITKIGYHTFYNCDSLTNMTIPNGVIQIMDSAFEDCNGLTHITIPNSVRNIGSWAFAGCNNLQYNTYDNAKYLGNSAAPYSVLVEAISTGITSCNIHTDTRFICYNAFENCDSLTSIRIPGGVVSMGELAFAYCDNLKSVTILDGVTNIVAAAFYNCTGLESVTIPVSVTNIYTEAFYNCTGLTDVYYSGKRAQWDAISVAAFNDALLNATLHCRPDVIPGDMDRNDQLTKDDVICLLLHVTMPNSFPANGNADFDGNGDVNSEDVISLLRYVETPRSVSLSE